MTNFIDDKSKAQFLDGTSDDDTFIIDGVSTDYDWEKVLDPRGETTMIVWKKDGRGQADVLNNIETLQFTDKTLTPELSGDGTIYTTTSTDDSDSSTDTSDDTSSDDDTPTHDTGLDEWIVDDYTLSEIIDGAGGHDSFVIEKDSSEYGWSPTQDGQGVVVWCPATGCFDILYNVEEIIFNDLTLQVSDIMNMDDPDQDDGDDQDPDTPTHDPDLDEWIVDDYTLSEIIDGAGGHDSFVIEKDSSEYGWSPTQDGQGVVVWCPATGCFDILYNVEEIIFNDITVQVSDIMNMDDPDQDDGSDDGDDQDPDTPPHDLDLDEYIYDDDWLTEEIDGHGGHDSFVIQADSSYFEWSLTDDGEGIVVWNNHTNCYDVLYNVEEIIFDDMVFDITQVLGGDGSGGGSDNNGQTGSDDDEYIMDDAWASETIDGGAGEDTFVIDGHSDDFMWDYSDDGQGIVIWNSYTNAYDTLYNVEEIYFDDMSVWVDDLIGDGSDGGSDNGGQTGSDDDEYIMDDAWTSETIDGGAGEDTFVIDGHSDDFMWDWTDDGQGIMIWNLYTDETDTLYNVEEISFDDVDVWVDDLGNNSGSNNNTNSYTNNNTTNNNTENNSTDNTNNNNTNTGGDEFIIDDANVSEVIDGGDGDDTFVIDGNSADFAYDENDDGTGILIFNELTGTTDELLNVEEIEFNDAAFLVDDLIG